MANPTANDINTQLLAERRTVQTLNPAMKTMAPYANAPQRQKPANISDPSSFQANTKIWVPPKSCSTLNLLEMRNSFRPTNTASLTSMATLKEMPSHKLIYGNSGIRYILRKVCISRGGLILLHFTPPPLHML